jgi:hypothetical protein
MMVELVLVRYHKFSISFFFLSIHTYEKYRFVVDKSTEEEAYRIASEEIHSKISKSLNLGEGGNANNEAAFKLLSGALGGALFKGKGGVGGKESGSGGSLGKYLFFFSLTLRFFF